MSVSIAAPITSSLLLSLQQEYRHTTQVTSSRILGDNPGSAGQKDQAGRFPLATFFRKFA